MTALRHNWLLLSLPFCSMIALSFRRPRHSRGRRLVRRSAVDPQQTSLLLGYLDARLPLDYHAIGSRVEEVLTAN